MPWIDQIPRRFAPAEAAGPCPRNDKQCKAFAIQIPHPPTGGFGMTKMVPSNTFAPALSSRIRASSDEAESAGRRTFRALRLPAEICICFCCHPESALLRMRDLVLPWIDQIPRRFAPAEAAGPCPAETAGPCSRNDNNGPESDLSKIAFCKNNNLHRLEFFRVKVGDLFVQGC